MNLQLLNLGSAPDDHTGDTLRAGGTKINSNFVELFLFTASRHRQCPVVYKITDGSPSFLSASGVNVSMLGPFVGAIAAKNDGRGERNLAVWVPSDVSNAWLLPEDANSYLYLQVNPSNGVVTYNFSTLEPVNSQTPPLGQLGQHWFDMLEGTMKEWNGFGWQQVYRLFVAHIVTQDAEVISTSYYTDNDEILMARNEAIKMSIVLG